MVGLEIYCENMGTDFPEWIKCCKLSLFHNSGEFQGREDVRKEALKMKV